MAVIVNQLTSARGIVGGIRAEQSTARPVHPCSPQKEAVKMPKENDLQGQQDMGGKHGGQAGMPKPETRTAAQQGIIRDDKGQEQPADKSRAQQK
jgi:hypothetical protein